VTASVLERRAPLPFERENVSTRPGLPAAPALVPRGSISASSIPEDVDGPMAAAVRFATEHFGRRPNGIALKQATTTLEHHHWYSASWQDLGPSGRLDVLVDHSGRVMHHIDASHLDDEEHFFPSRPRVSSILQKELHIDVDDPVRLATALGELLVLGWGGCGCPEFLLEQCRLRGAAVNSRASGEQEPASTSTDLRAFLEPFCLGPQIEALSSGWLLRFHAFPMSGSVTQWTVEGYERELVHVVRKRVMPIGSWSRGTQ
jgi:hypothetical protein